MEKEYLVIQRETLGNWKEGNEAHHYVYRTSRHILQNMLRQRKDKQPKWIVPSQDNLDNYCGLDEEYGENVLVIISDGKVLSLEEFKKENKMKKKAVKKTKEVVINTCYGGFGLSDEAIKRLYEKGSKYVESKPNTGGNKYMFEVEFMDVLLSENYSCDDIERRSDSLLIEVVKELGSEKASGRYSKLRIVGIPADVDVEIDEYDGIEEIRECSRRWS
jgi:hypothetical protein